MTVKTAAEKRINVFAKKVLRMLGKNGTHTAVFLLGGDEMARLKLLYLGRKAEKEVDVLAFPEPKGFPHPETRNRFLGEIYINKKIAFSDWKRARFLAVHGILHLLGYSHGKKSDTIKMERKEQKLLKQLSVIK